MVGLFQRHQTGELTPGEFASALGVLGAEPDLQAIGRTIGMVFMGIRYGRAVEDAAEKLPQVVRFVQATAGDAGLREALKAILAVIDAFRRVSAGDMSAETFAKYVRTSGGEAPPFIGEVSEFTYKGFSYESAKPARRNDNALQVVRCMEQSKDDAELRAQLQSIIGGDGNISAPSELDAAEAQSLLGERSGQIYRGIRY
ncbi:MAG: hypothetical protein ACNA8G_09670 [Gammaproteobacteria bacterium]